MQFLSAISLWACYAMSGSDVAYGATRRSSAAWQCWSQGWTGGAGERKEPRTGARGGGLRVRNGSLTAGNGALMCEWCLKGEQQMLRAMRVRLFARARARVSWPPRSKAFSAQCVGGAQCFGFDLAAGADVGCVGLRCCTACGESG
eukprot:2460584-Rhodomonas_salina.8